MNERIRSLRKALGLTQEKFAEKLHIKRNTLANYEIGRNEPIDAVVTLICNTFNASEDWLRHGTGEMFSPMDRQDEIARLATDLFKGENGSFKERLILALARLDEKDWEVLEKIANELAKEKD